MISEKAYTLFYKLLVLTFITIVLIVAAALAKGTLSMIFLGISITIGVYTGKVYSDLLKDVGKNEGSDEPY